MNSFVWTWTHVSFAALLCFGLLASLRRTPPVPVVAAMIFICAAAAFIPVHETDLSGFALAHIGVLSTPTVVLIVFEILTSLRLVQPIQCDSRRLQNICWVAAGFLLYPSATGFLHYDVYSLGYAQPIAWVVLVASFLSIFFDYQLLAFCLIAAILCHHFNVHESPNLWDYLIDPWLCLAAVAQLTWSAVYSAIDCLKKSVT